MRIICPQIKSANRLTASWPSSSILAFLLNWHSSALMLDPILKPQARCPSTPAHQFLSPTEIVLRPFPRQCQLATMKQFPCHKEQTSSCNPRPRTNVLVIMKLFPCHKEQTSSCDPRPRTNVLVIIALFLLIICHDVAYLQ